MSLFTPPNYLINTPRIKVSTDINYIPENLQLGELSYGFNDNTLFIGSPDSNLATVIISDDKINNLIANYFNNNLTAHISSLLATKADLTHSNVFVNMNEFPYLNISTSAPSQRNLPVTVRMLTEYITSLNLIPPLDPPSPDPNLNLLVITTDQGLASLSYNFTSNSLIATTLDNQSSSTIFSGPSTFASFLTSSVTLTVTDKAPSSAAVAFELNKKADLTHSNIFTNMNEFPYLRIADSAPSQRNLPVTIRMLREYVQETLAELGLIQNVSVGLYQFLDEALEEVIVQHNKHTVNFEVIEILEAETDAQHIVPITVLDDNSFKLNFSYPILLSLVKVIFYV